MLIEEIPTKRNANSSTVYFTSSINISARPTSRLNQQNSEAQNQPKAKKTKINYNLNDLMNKQIQSSDSSQLSSGPLKSSQQLTLERSATKRLLDLSKETSQSTFDLPKNFEYKNRAGKGTGSRQGNTPGTKKILSARRNLNSYFEEERNLVSINSILGLNYQYLDQLDSTDTNNKGKKNSPTKLSRPRIKLCCICSNLSSYARCNSCGLFFCKIQCYKLHQESRCL
ncbi:hypothetical protein CANTEDRAFT_116216 [Yamadazyma tenuis ATCC 10573]|uniref:HIT-type domain-containing protein n=1 Tax=Candida tenuis (strain ATCC 10573 / BCRC 21748 / CBS 615 / JCM 9827 / NBRC 10315 / NRRL Y-1498 / VKM Y-70) TaxID=590646 RepID=G3BC97_CANTC|nr:uncharacterized protein CANTEDRAFT_116216 [Yamadazyma tenuis ATCC 10573]EGV60149.1 hypothetical protein CANTEDRAFT_116216 [Yamadazyma tenuis ATCC 10573]